jgi:aminoglycoside 3-N-acetyltransferase
VKSISFLQAASILREVGIRPGDHLLIHSALQYLGRPEGGPGMYLEAVTAVAATIAVPAFTLAFARGEPYDPRNTPSQDMGVFSEFVRHLPAAKRTLHPMQSVATVGEVAADLAGRDTLSAFDPGSAFERMLELDFKLLLLGADIHAVSMVHYCEQRAVVPYRYWKDFTGQVRIYSDQVEEPHWETRTYRMYARDLALNPHLVLSPIQARLEARNQWHSRPINYGFISLCRLRDFVLAGDELLAQDPWALVENRPT